MATLTLVEEMLGLETRPADSDGLTDFVASIGTSNGMLIPLDLLVQTRLHTNPSRAHTELLKREYRQKSALLDDDRHIAACLCTLVASAQDAAPVATHALAASIKVLAPAHVARIVAFELESSHAVMAALLAESDAAELLMHVEIGTAAGHAAPLLHKLRKHLHDHPRTRLVAVMGNKRSDGSAINLSAAATLLTELAATVDQIFLLPLFAGSASGSSFAGRRCYDELAALLIQLGLVRQAPGLFGPARNTMECEQPLSWLNRIMVRLPQCDLLGLGPAAHSRFNDVCFKNHAVFSDYAHDLERGGFAIARTFMTKPANHFIDAVILNLASGREVDLPALAMGCQCGSPVFLKACIQTVDTLHASGAISSRDARCVALKAANDAHFGDIHTQLGLLRSEINTVTRMPER